MTGTPTLYWLRRDFRLHDNPALSTAAEAGPVLPVFVIDAALRAQGSASRWRLEQALRAHNAALRARFGQGLLIVEGEARDLLPGLARQIGARAIHAADWPCPEGRAPARALHDALPDEITLRLHPGHLLVSPKDLATREGGSYRVYGAFARAVRARGVPAPLAEPAHLDLMPPPVAGPIAGLDIATLALAPDMRSGAAILTKHALAAGEEAALDRLDSFLADRLSSYPHQRDRLDHAAGSGLSEALALGEISPRRIWHRVQMLLSTGEISGADGFLSELLWREFSWHLLVAFPQMAAQPWRADWDRFPWRPGSDTPELGAWQRALTGEPVIDAAMRELRATGRMHNRARMIVASYLTKHLLIDWRRGLDWFADCLTDWDPAANAMNWQWVAGCGPDAAPYFRIFNPATQAEKFDPDARYRNRWLRPGSEGAQDYLLTVPGRWNAPRMPPAKPVVDLRVGRERALAALASMRGASMRGAPL